MKNHASRLVSGASLVAALLVTLLPLPQGVEFLRPPWVAMVLIYWCIETPEKIGMATAFAAGLALDLLIGDSLGRHALGLVVIAFITLRFHNLLRFYPLWQKTLVILLLLINDRILYLLALLIGSQPLPDWRIWLRAGVGALLWPWLYLLLDDLRLRARQHGKST